MPLALLLRGSRHYYCEFVPYNKKHRQTLLPDDALISLLLDKFHTAILRAPLFRFVVGHRFMRAFAHGTQVPLVNTEADQCLYDGLSPALREGR